MRPIAPFVFALCFLSTAPAIAQINALPSEPHVLVFGSATARAVPDRFLVEIEISETRPSAADARAVVAERFDGLISLLESSEVEASEIEATALDMSKQNRWNPDSRDTEFVGIVVRREVKALFDSIEKMEAFVRLLETSAGMTINDVRPELSSAQALRRALRAEAIADARTKAQEMAQAYGVELAGLYSVSDVAPEFDYGIRQGQWPSTFEWDTSEDAPPRLDRIAMTGSSVAPMGRESFRAGYVDFESRIYAVFRLAEEDSD